MEVQKRNGNWYYGLTKTTQKKVQCQSLLTAISLGFRSSTGGPESVVGRSVTMRYISYVFFRYGGVFGVSGDGLR